MESEENKHEIILSNETKKLAIFSSTSLITRGQKLVDLILLKNPLINKIEKILLEEYSLLGGFSGNYKTKQLLWHKIRLATALLEIGNNSAEEWTVNILNEEPENPKDLLAILLQKRELLQALSKAGKQEIASQYLLEYLRKSWDGRGFPILLTFNFFSDQQVEELIAIFRKASTAASQIGIINGFEKSGRREEKVISYLQDIAQNSPNPSLKIQACEALINLGQSIIAKTALSSIIKENASSADDAKILLGMENSGETYTQAQEILLDKIKKTSNTFRLLNYISYLPKFGNRKLAISILLDLLASSNADEKDGYSEANSYIDALLRLDYKEEIFLDKLIDISIDKNTNDMLRIHSFYAMLQFENINETQAEKLLAFSQSSTNRLIGIFIGSVLANFQKTENLGVELLNRIIDEGVNQIGIVITDKILIQNKRLAFNSKFLNMLHNIPNKNWDTSACLTIIKLLQKVEK